MNEDELELFKEKMCTKICQLTRVVYLLNNKYLDSQAMIDAIKDSYETEIQNVTREANLVIGKLKKQIEELQKTDKVKEEIEILSKQYEDNIKLLREKLLKAQSESLENEKKLTLAHQAKVTYMVDEINKLKKSTKDKIKEMNQKYNDNVNDNNKTKLEMESIKQKFKKEINELNNSNRVLIDEKNAIINQQKNEIATKDMKISNILKEIDKYKSEDSKNQKTIKVLQDEITLLKENSAKNSSDEQAYKAKIERLSKFEGDYKQALLLIEELKQKLSFTNETLKHNENRKNELEQILEEAKLNKERLESIISKMKEEHTKDISNIKITYENSISTLEKKLNESKSSIEKLTKEKNDITAQLTSKHSEEIKSLELKHKEEIDKIKFDNSLSMNELKLKYDSHISNLKIQNIELNANKDQVKELQNKISSLEKQMSSQKEQNEKKEKDFKLQQIEVFKRMKKSFMEAMSLLQEKNENLNQEIKELEGYLVNRPSREDDLGEIARLQQELKIKDKEMNELKVLLSQYNNINNGGINSQKKLKVLGSLKDYKKPKYTNASYGMIFSKK